MKFRLKMTLCMLGLLSLLFGIGGSLLISASLRSSLEREKDVARHSYRMALSTLEIIGDLEGPQDDKDLADTLEQLSGKSRSPLQAPKTQAAGLRDRGGSRTSASPGGDGVFYAAGAGVSPVYLLPEQVLSELQEPPAEEPAGQKGAAEKPGRPEDGEKEADWRLVLVNPWKVQQWLMENSWRYGFILRYPNDKSDLTGIIYEPWHYRYVGTEAARDL